MKHKSCHFLSVAIGLSAICAMGQSPINDTLVVTFPNSFRVGSQTLSAGEYTIRQLSSASNSRLLEFSTDKGTSIQASATSIPALDNNNRNDSSVLLLDRGGVPHLHRIWVKGKSYGYEFPVEKDNGSTTTASNNGIRLTAIYSAPPALAAALEKEPVRQAEVEAPATPAPSNIPSVQPDPAPTQAAAPAAVLADTTPQQSTPEMPKTATNWLTMLLSGFGMLSLGWVIRTYSQRF